jgi:dihydroceramidase
MLFLCADPMVYGCSLVYRNPIYHQGVFGSLMIATFFREIYLLAWSDVSRTIPDKKKAAIVETLKTGLFLFLFGFFVWNLDNIFCGSWSQVKRAVGWPIAFFMEGEFIQGRPYSM